MAPLEVRANKKFRILGCSEKHKIQTELNQELGALRREVSMATAQAAVSTLKELKASNASPTEILEAFKDNTAVHQLDY